MQSELLTREVDRLRMRMAEMQSQSHLRKPDDISPYEEAIQDFSRTFDEVVAAYADLEQSHTALLQTSSVANLECRRYKALFEHAPLGYLVLDLAGNIQVCNATACQLLGTPHELLVGQSLLGLIPDDEKQVLGAFLRSRARDGPGTTGDLCFKVSLPAEDEVVLRLSEPNDPRQQPDELWVSIYGTSKWGQTGEVRDQPGRVRYPC
jgi:PAS domain-containing protein